MAYFPFDEDYEMLLDVEVPMRERKTRANVMTVYEAVVCHKSSKNHKLKPRERKRDATKKQEAKDKARASKRSHQNIDM